MAQLNRHPSILEKLPFFEYHHLPEGVLRDTSKRFHDLAYDLALDPNLDGSQLTLGLQHLLEAKDCAVRSALSNTLEAKSTS
jgi:hypothetical protein